MGLGLGLGVAAMATLRSSSSSSSGQEPRGPNDRYRDPQTPEHPGVMPRDPYPPGPDYGAGPGPMFPSGYGDGQPRSMPGPPPPGHRGDMDFYGDRGGRGPPPPSQMSAGSSPLIQLTGSSAPRNQGPASNGNGAHGGNTFAQSVIRERLQLDPMRMELEVCPVPFYILTRHIQFYIN